MVINYQRIYERLGYLFYSIAAADKVVTTTEVERLKEMVQRLWVPAEKSTDEFGTDAAHYIAISFDYLVNEGVDAHLAFENFRSYYLEHRDFFSPKMKGNIKSTAHTIARAFKGENKQELSLIKELELLLS